MRIGSGGCGRQIGCKRVESETAVGLGESSSESGPFVGKLIARSVVQATGISEGPTPAPCLGLFV